MIKVLFSVIVFILIALVDGREVFKSKNRKKISAYLTFFSAAVILGLLLIMGVKIPNPLDPVKSFIAAIFGKD